MGRVIKIGSLSIVVVGMAVAEPVDHQEIDYFRPELDIRQDQFGCGQSRAGQFGLFDLLLHRRA